MPAYPGVPGASVSVKSNISPIALQKGESCYVVGALASGATQLPVNDGNVAAENFAGASIAVDLQAGFEGMPPPMVSVEVFYPTADSTGASMAVQEADTDADIFYVTPSAAAYTLAKVTAGAIRSDLSPTGGKFMRVVRTLGSSAVPCTVKITRLA